MAPSFQTMTLLRSVGDFVGKTVTISGWVANVRSSGGIAFLQLRDGTGRIQGVVVKDQVSPETWEAATAVTMESSIEVTGIVKADKRAPSGFELGLASVRIIARAEEYPIGKKEHGPDFLLENRHLWIRAERQTAILRIRSEVVFAIQEFMRSEGFLLTHTPTFTPNPCEGGSDLFEVQYFDEKAYLTQNGQLYLEALAMALGRVYDLNPNFRAEKSKTRRHLTEFWSVNPEAAFLTHPDSMALQERLVVAIVRTALDRCAKELTMLERDLTTLQKTAEGNFPRLTYAEAIAKTQALGSDIKFGDDFGGDDETMLTKEYDRPIFVERWPKTLKPFYMKRDPDDATRVLNNDLYAPEGYGEIIGGSQREDDYAKLRQGIVDQKLNLADFEWYLDLRRYGSVPHSGFGLGIERMVAWLSGAAHVRETTPFPRLLNRLRP